MSVEKFVRALRAANISKFLISQSQQIGQLKRAQCRIDGKNDLGFIGSSCVAALLTGKSPAVATVNTLKEQVCPEVTLTNQNLFTGLQNDILPALRRSRDKLFGVSFLTESHKNSFIVNGAAVASRGGDELWKLLGANDEEYTLTLTFISTSRFSACNESLVRQLQIPVYFIC